MRQLAGCVALEEGLWFLVILGVVVLAIIGLLILLIWFLRSRNRPARTTQDSLSVGFKDWLPKLTGPMVAPIVVVLTAIVVSIALIGFLLFGISKIFGHSYFVALDMPSTSVSLEYVRDKFQPDTQATIIIKEPAKKFLITGSYEGSCVRDMIDSICRRYSSQISCDTSYLNGTITVDLSKSR